MGRDSATFRDKGTTGQAKNLAKGRDGSGQPKSGTGRAGTAKNRDGTQDKLLCHGTVLEHPFPLLERPFLLCPVLSRVPSRILAVPARPVPNFGCPGPSRPLARFLACPVVPLSRDNEGTSVPLSQKVALSRPVGNPTPQ